MKLRLEDWCEFNDEITMKEILDILGEEMDVIYVCNTGDEEIPIYGEEFNDCVERLEEDIDRIFDNAINELDAIVKKYKKQKKEIQEKYLEELKMWKRRLHK